MKDSIVREFEERKRDWTRDTMFPHAHLNLEGNLELRPANSRPGSISSLHEMDLSDVELKIVAMVQNIKDGNWPVRWRIQNELSKPFAESTQAIGSVKTAFAKTNFSMEDLKRVSEMIHGIKPSSRREILKLMEEDL